MFCEKCGNKMSMDAMFCNNCGAKVNTVDNHVVVEEKPVYNPQPVVVETNSEVEVSVQQQAKTITNKPKNKKKGIIIGVVAGIIAIAVAVVSVLFFTGAFDYTGEYYDVESQVIYDENGQPIYDENSQTIYDENSQPNSAEQSINFPNQEYYYVPGESMEPQGIVTVTGEASFYDDNRDYIEDREITIEVPIVGLASQHDMDDSWELASIAVRQYEGRAYVEIYSSSLTMRLAYDSYDMSIENLVIGTLQNDYRSILFMRNGKAVKAKFGEIETLMNGYSKRAWNDITDAYGNAITYDEYEAESQRIEEWIKNDCGYHPINPSCDIYYDYYF